MITLTIKGISRTAHRELKKRAARHGRSLNTEAIAVLEASVRSAPAEAGAVIEQARQFRNSLRFQVRVSDVRAAKSGGRV